MAKQKEVADEVIISALLKNGTIRATAKAVGLSERTIYNRMGKAEFIGLYRGVKADIMRKAVFDINEQLGQAVKTVTDIMNDENTAPAVRLQASQFIINNASKLTDQLNSIEAQTNNFLKAIEFDFDLL